MILGIVSYCDNCLIETPGHELERFELDGHRDNQSVFAPRWIETCTDCVPTVTGRGYQKMSRP